MKNNSIISFHINNNNNNIKTFMIFWWLLVAVYNSITTDLFVDALIYQSTHTWSGIRNQVKVRIQQQQQQQYQHQQNQKRHSSSCCSQQTTKTKTTKYNNNNMILSLQMRDVSASYWFNVGDYVKVVDDVYKAGYNLRNKQGKVVETWEKCDVDPTCCCAEQVDIGMAVRVEFVGTIEEADDEEGEEEEPDNGKTFIHYFAESELIKVKQQQQQQQQEDNNIKLDKKEETEPPAPTTDASSSTTTAEVEVAEAFDGMSCVAFKLDQLKMGKQAQRLAKFEESRRAAEQQQQRQQQEKKEG